MRNKIYVLSHGNQWKVQCEHCKTALVDTQTKAIQIAKEHVRDYPEGTLAQIIIQGSDGKFRAEWTYGKDPFPPRG